MPTGLSRMTFTVTPDMEELMDEAKQMFYSSTQSEMVRKLIVAGIAAIKAEKAVKEKTTENGSSATWQE